MSFYSIRSWSDVDTNPNHRTMGSDHFSTRLQPQQQTALTFYAESGQFAFSKSLLTTEDNELDGALKVAVCQAGC